MTQITRNGFVNKNGDKVILKPIVPGATPGNLAEFDTDGSVKDSGVSKSSIGGGGSITIDSTPTADSNNAVSSGGVYNAVVGLEGRYEGPKLYLYEQNRSGSMVYVSENTSKAFYKFGKLTIRYVKPDGTRETLSNANLNDFAEKAPAGVNILLPIAVYETDAAVSSGISATVLPAIFVQGSDRSWARFYVGNFCFSFNNTPVDGKPQYTIDSDGFCTGAGKIYDMIHIFRSGYTVYTEEKSVGSSAMSQYEGSRATVQISSSVYSQLKVGDTLYIYATYHDEVEDDDVDIEDTVHVSAIYPSVPYVALDKALDSKFFEAESCDFYVKSPMGKYAGFFEKADKKELSDAIIRVLELEKRVAALEAELSPLSSPEIVSES